MNHVDKKTGFTLIELMLAMTFISVLLLAIAMTIIQISQIYNRGMTLKEVNQSARSVSEELKRTITSTEKFDMATNYVETTAGGRVCTGKYSYLWNTKEAIARNDAALLKKNNVALRLAKVPDIGSVFCAKAADGSPSKISSNITATEAAATTEVLNVGDHDLSIHNFKVQSGAGSVDEVTGQQLYVISFTIGTSDTAALKKVDGSLTFNACKEPNETGSDLAYCSIQNFTIVIRAGNRVN